MHKPTFLKTIAEYNGAVQRDIPYNPTVEDGRTTKGLAIDKTNWAMPLEKAMPSPPWQREPNSPAALRRTIGEECLTFANW